MERASGTLGEYLLDPENNPKALIPLNPFLEILAAINFIHGNGVVHGDIKPDNILVFIQDECAVLKLADFGSALIFDTIDAKLKACQFTGTLPFAPLVESGSMVNGRARRLFRSGWRIT